MKLFAQTVTRTNVLIVVGLSNGSAVYGWGEWGEVRASVLEGARSQLAITTKRLTKKQTDNSKDLKST